MSCSVEDDLNQVGRPESPPDLSMTGSKSSKSSSFHSSYHSDDNSILEDVAHFEDIGLNDDARPDPEIEDFVEQLPNPYSITFTTDLRALKRPPRSKTQIVIRPRDRELTNSKARPPFPSLRGPVRAVTGEVYTIGVVPSTMPRRGFMSPSTPSLVISGRRYRSTSPATHPTSAHSLPNSRYGSSPVTRRSSWQSNKERRKSAKELELECDEDDGDEVPDECLLENVPISPRPLSERTASSPPSPDQIKKEKVKPAGNGTPPIPIAQGSLKGSPPRPTSGHTTRMGSFPLNHDPFRPTPRSKSWTAALSDLSDEAKALTEALEAHSDLQDLRGVRSAHDRPRVKSSGPELPPLRRNDIMIDPLPISKEKEAVLSRTRPSWLPPKDPVEERRHLREYQRMMELSLAAERKRASAKREKMAHKDNTVSSLLRIWEEHVLPNWDVVMRQRRTRELWWRGIAPRSRGTVWQRAVGNELGLTEASYHAALSRAKDVERRLAKDEGTTEDRRKGEWFNAIRRDVCVTYQELRIFQPGGPLSETLVDVLMAYVVYRSDVGYINGMNTIAALLLLNFPTAPSAFLTLANALNRPLPLSFHTHDPAATFRFHSLVLSTVSAKFPNLYAHLCKTASFDKHAREFLSPIFSSLFTQHLDLDAVTRLWDVWVFEGDAVLVRAMVALLGLAEARLYSVRSRDELAHILKTVAAGPDAGGEELWMRAVRDAGRDRTSPTT